MAAAFVLLAGGANALAITMWTVSKTSSNTTCSYPSQTTCNTIQSAVTAASSGDVIQVGPGPYSESVVINETGQNRDGLTLLGAQAGRDARVGRDELWKESVVNATGTGNPGITVNANFVVIDGFTITGDSAATPPAGIVVGSKDSGYYWAQILNNILENSGTGVYLFRPASDSVHRSPYAVIEHNLFRDNTAGKGANVGFGIFSNGATGPVITENAFTGNKAVAIVISGGDHAEVTNNTSENDGAFVAYVGAIQSLFSHNLGKKFGHKGAPVVIGANSIYPDAAVDIGPGNSHLVISDNDLEEGESHISNGIAFTNTFPAAAAGTNPTYNYYVTVKNNKIKGFPENGIVADTQTGGTLIYSWILGNEVLDNGSDGISIQDSNYNISLFDNQVEGNLLDCHDATTGGVGTLETQDIWLNDTGNSSNLTGPPPLCTPGRGHNHDWR
jgi:nitrous oxidase accessory protein NosD